MWKTPMMQITSWTATIVTLMSRSPCESSIDRVNSSGMSEISLFWIFVGKRIIIVFYLFRSHFANADKSEWPQRRCFILFCISLPLCVSSSTLFHVWSHRNAPHENIHFYKLTRNGISWQTNMKIYSFSISPRGVKSWPMSMRISFIAINGKRGDLSVSVPLPRCM